MKYSAIELRRMSRWLMTDASTQQFSEFVSIVANRLNMQKHSVQALITRMAAW